VPLFFKSPPRAISALSHPLVFTPAIGRSESSVQRSLSGLRIDLADKEKDAESKAQQREMLQNIFNRRILRSVPCMWYKPNGSAMSTQDFSSKRQLYLIVYFHGNGEDLITTTSFCKHLSIILQVPLK
jgi:hypothetical protein